MDQKNTRAFTISPRLEDYLKRTEAGLADRTKTPSQHAAARRVRDLIRAISSQKNRLQKPPHFQAGSLTQLK